MEDYIIFVGHILVIKVQDGQKVEVVAVEVLDHRIPV